MGTEASEETSEKVEDSDEEGLRRPTDRWEYGEEDDGEPRDEGGVHASIVVCDAGDSKNSHGANSSVVKQFCGD